MILILICKSCGEPFKNEILHCKSSGKKFCPACKREKVRKYNEKRNKGEVSCIQNIKDSWNEFMQALMNKWKSILDTLNKVFKKEV